jgi:hypothetical protein
MGVRSDGTIRATEITVGFLELSKAARTYLNKNCWNRCLIDMISSSSSFTPARMTPPAKGSSKRMKFKRVTEVEQRELERERELARERETEIDR